MEEHQQSPSRLERQLDSFLPIVRRVERMASFQCGECDEIFPSRNKMFIHIRETHDKLKVTASETSCNQIPMDLNRFEELNNMLVDDTILIAGEDSSYRVVVKPQGLPTMGKVVEGCTSLMRSSELLLPGAFEHNLPYKKAIPCHRLDSATGGLVVCSKTRPAEVCIKMCFRQKLIHKRYRAIVPGRLEPSEGDMNSPIGGKDSLTKYKVAHYTRSARYGWITTVDCWPVTGRKHQIRKHLLFLGHAILGDRRYSHASTWPERIGGKDLMFLWSLEVDLPHPINTNSDAENETIRLENAVKIADEIEKHGHHIATVDSDEDQDSMIVTSSAGNTTSGADSNSLENRLLLSSGTQIRQEMYGIESRRNVHIVIDEPLYYGLFRQCHDKEWISSEPAVA